MHYRNNWLKHKEGLKCLKQKVAFKPKKTLKGKTKAKEAKKQCVNSMEDVECYNQPLIDMKEQYQKNVEMFTITTQLLSNNM